MNGGHGLAGVGHAAGRVRQTLTDFDNGLQLLTALATRRDELEFRVKGGVTITCPNVAGARVPVYEIFAEDAYRLGWFTAGLADDFHALDIGGHIGCFSVALATLKPRVSIWTFEASPSTAAFTRRNVTDNGLLDRVTVTNVAVSSTAGTMAFADNAGGSGLNGITAPTGTKTIDIEAITFADAKQRAGGSVQLVKIDTEGAEYDIVLGSDPADWADVQRVVLEHHDVPGHAWSELEAFFASAGLTIAAREDVTPRLGTVWLSRTPL
jgi:FkbM family methyltransferase